MVINRHSLSHAACIRFPRRNVSRRKAARQNGTTRLRNVDTCRSIGQKRDRVDEPPNHEVRIVWYSQWDSILLTNLACESNINSRRRNGRKWEMFRFPDFLGISTATNRYFNFHRRNTQTSDIEGKRSEIVPIKSTKHAFCLPRWLARAVVRLYTR